MEYLNVAEAKKRAGLRLVLTTGVPGPWGESVKALFHVKGIEYTPVAQIAGAENTELMEWTGQNSAPVVIYNDERIRSSWESILWFAERHSPEPALIPTHPRQRALMFGLLRELVGECGFAWYRRLQLLPGGKQIPGLEKLFSRLAAKYGYHEEELAIAETEIASILKLLSGELNHQAKQNSRYYIGDRLSALDIYAAVFFSVMLRPLSHEEIPMPRGMRKAYEKEYREIEKAIDPILLDHRRYIFDTYLTLPMNF